MAPSGPRMDSRVDVFMSRRSFAGAAAAEVYRTPSERLGFAHDPTPAAACRARAADTPAGAGGEAATAADARAVAVTSGAVAGVAPAAALEALAAANSPVAGAGKTPASTRCALPVPAVRNYRAQTFLCSDRCNFL